MYIYYILHVWSGSVYSCLLDASKAFDRVHYVKLFNILLYKKVPLVIIRFLFDKRQGSYGILVNLNIFVLRMGLNREG